MGFCESTCAMLGGAIVVGAVSAAVGAGSGAAGAKIFDSAGYSGYDVLTATQVGAAGNALLGGVIGGVGAYMRANKKENSFFSRERSKESSMCAVPAGYVAFVGKQTLGGVIGYGLLIDIASSKLPLPQSAASLATGSAVIGAVVFGTLGLCCCLSICCGLGALATLFGLAKNDEDTAMNARPSVGTP